MAKAKRKAAEQIEWMVPMRYRGQGTCFVTAETADEAVAMARSGAGNFEEGETEDWEVAGSPEPNV